MKSRTRILGVYLLLCLTIALVSLADPSDATLSGRLWRRQSGETEREATTIAASASSGSGNLEPPKPQSDSAPNFPPSQFHMMNNNNNFGRSYGHPGAFRTFGPMNGPTNFVPFGMQIPPNPRSTPMMVRSPLQASQASQPQTNLGRRLLTMFGINNNNNETSSSSPDKQNANGEDATVMMKALRNSTVANQLTRGVNSIYGNLSKMYNETVQQQINVLQERWMKHQNGSQNPWHQRMAQQIPDFFKHMASEVSRGQDNLNRLLSQVSQAKNVSLESSPSTIRQQPPRSTFFDVWNLDEFFNHQPFEAELFDSRGDSTVGIDRSMNLQQQQQQQPQRDLGNHLMDFWNQQVQPQIGMLKNQIGGLWRELSSSGVLRSDMLSSPSRRDQISSSSSNSDATKLVDNIMKDLESNASELLQTDSSKKDDKNGMLSTQMQNRLTAMQRDLNQLWGGLTNSLQGAIENVKSMSNSRRQQFGFGNQAQSLDSSASTNKETADPAVNEISTKLSDIGKLQKDTDMIYDAVQRQQQPQQPSLGDRFGNFLNRMDFSGQVDQLPNRFSESVSRLGNAVGDFWNNAPDRFHNFVNNQMRPQGSRNPNNNQVPSESSSATIPQGNKPEGVETPK